MLNNNQMLQHLVRNSMFVNDISATPYVTQFAILCDIKNVTMGK